MRSNAHYSTKFILNTSKLTIIYVEQGPFSFIDLVKSDEKRKGFTIQFPFPGHLQISTSGNIVSHISKHSMKFFYGQIVLSILSKDHTCQCPIKSDLKSSRRKFSPRRKFRKIGKIFPGKQTLTLCLQLKIRSIFSKKKNSLWDTTKPTDRQTNKQYCKTYKPSSSYDVKIDKDFHKIYFLDYVENTQQIVLVNHLKNPNLAFAGCSLLNGGALAKVESIVIIGSLHKFNWCQFISTCVLHIGLCCDRQQSTIRKHFSLKNDFGFCFHKFSVKFKQ